MRLQRDSFLIVLAVLLTGCNENTVPQETASSTPPQPKVDDPKTASFVGLTAPKPVTWIEHPPANPMRTANYTVPGRDGSEAAHIVVSYFGPAQGGTIDANISRWRLQFQVDENGDLREPKIDRLEVDSMPVTLVELAGEWKEMGSVSFKPDHVFLMAIIEAPVGRVFIRFTGQTATVEANRNAFMEMILGLRKTPN